MTGRTLPPDGTDETRPAPGRLEPSVPPRQRRPEWNLSKCAIPAGAAAWTLVFALAVGATQIGSLERESFNDESTFTVVAARVLDGELPYVKLFDNKPPMIFLLLAGAMAAFGESLFVVRAVGDLCLLMSCIAVFAIARRRTDLVSAGLGGLALIAVHAVEYAVETHTELPAMAMLMAALWLLLARRDRWWAIAAAGLLLSLSVLTRSNLGFVAAALFAWLLAAASRPSLGVHRWAAALFACAGLLPAAGLILLYASADALAELRLANIEVALAYSGQIGMWRALLLHGRIFLNEALATPLLLLPFSATLVIGMAVSLRNGWRDRPKAPNSPTSEQAAQTGAPTQEAAASRAELELLWLAFAATFLAVLATGNVFRHYWLQLYPIGAVFGAYGIAWLRSKARLRWAGYLLPAIAVGGALAQTAPSAFRLATVPDHLAERHTVRAAAAAIKAEQRPGDTIYAFNGQLIYWYLDMAPVSAIVHPSLLAKRAVLRPLAEAGYVAEDELGRILNLRPTYLVTVVQPTSRGPIPNYLHGEDAKAFGNLLSDHYRVLHDDGAEPKALRVYKLRR